MDIRDKFKTYVKDHMPSFLLNKLKDLRKQYIENSLYFQVHLTNHCNLKCKCCSHFSPISEEKNLDIKILENDFKRLASLGRNKIRQIDLLGGEPLLHPEINNCLIIARKYFKRAKILLITNGILLPAEPDNFWKICKKNNIVLSISQYPISIGLNEIKEKGKLFGTKLIFNSNNIFGHFRIDVNGKQNEIENINMCYESKNCNCLDNGKIFLCYIPACIDTFNKKFNLNIPVSKDDYIDIYESNSIQEIMDFLKKPVPFCKYCDVKNRNNIDWGISKRTIEEWV